MIEFSIKNAVHLFAFLVCGIVCIDLIFSIIKYLRTLWINRKSRMNKFIPSERICYKISYNRSNEKHLSAHILQAKNSLSSFYASVIYLLITCIPFLIILCFITFSDFSPHPVLPQVGGEGYIPPSEFNCTTDDNNVLVFIYNYSWLIEALCAFVSLRSLLIKKSPSIPYNAKYVKTSRRKKITFSILYWTSQIIFVITIVLCFYIQNNYVVVNNHYKMPAPIVYENLQNHGLIPYVYPENSLGKPYNVYFQSIKAGSIVKKGTKIMLLVMPLDEIEEMESLSAGL